jgi:hypothetical protein
LKCVGITSGVPDQAGRLFLCAKPMATTFLYCCPNTRQTVQGWSADDVTDDGEYQSIACLACAQLHLIKPDNWKSAGGERGLRGPAAIGQARPKIGTPSAGIGFAHLGPEAATRVPKRNCPAITGSTRLPNMPPRFEINVTGRARRGRLASRLPSVFCCFSFIYPAACMLHGASQPFAERG